MHGLWKRNCDFDRFVETQFVCKRFFPLQVHISPFAESFPFFPYARMSAYCLWKDMDGNIRVPRHTCGTCSYECLMRLWTRVRHFANSVTEIRGRVTMARHSNSHMRAWKPNSRYSSRASQAYMATKRYVSRCRATVRYGARPTRATCWPPFWPSVILDIFTHARRIDTWRICEKFSIYWCRV